MANELKFSSNSVVVAQETKFNTDVFDGQVTTTQRRN